MGRTGGWGCGGRCQEWGATLRRVESRVGEGLQGDGEGGVSGVRSHGGGLARVELGGKKIGSVELGLRDGPGEEGCRG